MGISKPMHATHHATVQSSRLEAPSAVLVLSFAGFGPEGGRCKFKVAKEEKGPAAKQVQLLGAAEQMRAWMGWGKGWGKGYGYGMPYMG